MPLYSLFPQPVYFSNIKRALTKAETNVINQCKEKTFQNVGNLFSDENYILENPILKNINKELYKIVLDYFNKIVCTSNSITPHFTQSWLNYTKSDEYHHRHSHNNSYVSGVFFIDANKDMDSIKFYKTDPAGIVLEVGTYNTHNATSWWYPVETGDVVLFPSSLSHGVDRKKGKNTRTSLAFNVFFTGTIGDKKGLTELIFK